MARQQIKKSTTTTPDDNDFSAPSVEKPEGTVQVTSHTPVEPMPEQAGSVTSAAANAIKPTVDKGLSRGAAAQLAKQEAGEVPEVTHFRVLADKYVNLGGFRTQMRVGKELSSTQYNIRHLRQQGVRMEQFDPATGDAL